MKKLLIVIVIFMMFGCEPATNIKIGVNSWPPCEVWYIAQSQGYFDDLDVEIVRFSSWSDNMAALYKGNTDVTHSTYFNSVYYSDKGRDGVILAPIDFIEGADGLVIKEDIKEISNLKGKKIGVEIGTDEHFLLSKALLLNGIELKDVVLTSIPSFSSYEDFINDEVDALFTYEPFLSIAAESGNGEIVFTTNELPNYMIDVLVVSKNDEYSEAYNELMTAWYKSIEYIKENPREAYEIMAVNTDMNAEEFGVFFESFNFYTKEEAIDILEGESVREKLLEMKTFTVENELTSDTVDVKSLLLSPLLEGTE